MICPRCFADVEKDVCHYERETLVVYRCLKCGYVERHHHPKKAERPRWLTPRMSISVNAVNAR